MTEGLVSPNNPRLSTNFGELIPSVLLTDRIEEEELAHRIDMI
jgi:hypothetical protein